MRHLKQENDEDAAIPGNRKKISVIICSINSERCEKALLDISKNIGVEYELIVFDNREPN